MAAIYDRFMRAGEDACVGSWRQELLDEARGRVLEIGAGTGLNLPRYGACLSEIVLCEPDANMRRKLEDRLRAVRPSVPVAIVGAEAEGLPFPDGSFDTVVSTLVLCSVKDPAQTLREVRRVLRPGGRLLFLEHVADDDPGREAWQRRIEPVWKRVAGNCHLRRRTCVSMRDAGFRFERFERESMTKALPFVQNTIRGRAVVDAITPHLRVAEMV
jgi:ubiquinone/menaquinone biosynthesis C-methylase UbiE